MSTFAQIEAARAHFGSVANTLGSQLSAASPRVVALVAKWSKEDLVPGLSDMDFRIVCDEETTAEDWVLIDRHVGNIHREMVSEHPEWNRINEHTPGAGISLAELGQERLHHPEHPVWTVWWGRDDFLADFRARTLARQLCGVDEHYHLSRFLAYYSPYRHGIDPPINLGEFEPKYPLHSRCWHYFAPPMLSAATLLARRHFDSKRTGLAWLAENGFAAPQTRAVLEQVDAHYDTPEKTDPQRLARFEQFLFTAFEELLEPVRDSCQHLEMPRAVAWQQLKEHLAANLVDPLVVLLDHVRYARIRAGRYYFYLHAPPHFSAERQLVVEQSWTRKLVDTIVAALRALQGDQGLSPADCFHRLHIEPSRGECEALERMQRLAGLQLTESEMRREYAQAIAWYPDFYRLIERALQRLCASGKARVGGVC